MIVGHGNQKQFRPDHMRCLLNQSDAKLINQSRVGRPRFPALQTVGLFYPEHLSDLFELVHNFVLLLLLRFKCSFVLYSMIFVKRDQRKKGRYFDSYGLSHVILLKQIC